MHTINLILPLMGKAYICKCRVEDFKRDLMESKACPHRNLPPEMMVEQFDQIITGQDTDKE